MKLTSSASFSPSIRISLRLKIHQAQAKNFCRVLDIRVTQVMEPDMLQSRVLEDPLVECYHRVGVIHFSCSAGWEHPRIVGVFGVLLLQQLHGILRNGHLADGIAGVGAA